MNKSKKIIIRVWAMLMLSFVFVGCTNQNISNAGESISILFVGNSHVRTGNVPGQLQELANLHGIELAYVDVSINGFGLDGALRDNAIREMQNGNFDYVVMQQPAGRGGRVTADVDGFFNNIRTFSEIVRENGAIPVLYYPMWMGVDGQPNEELHTIFSEMFKQAAYENDIILTNIGDVWVYAHRTIQGISLYARDGIHANHEGAFLATSVFMATLFDLQVENIPSGSVIDSVPMLNILTIVVFLSVIIFTLYRYAKKQPLHMKKSLIIIISLALLQVMSLFPHVFLFIEGSNRLLLLYAIIFGLLIFVLYSTYNFVRIVFIDKQSLNIAKRYNFYVAVCCAIYALTFIPVLELRNPLYMGNNAVALVQVVLSFFDLF